MLAAALTEVRAVVAELTEARRSGAPVAALERRQALLENRVRDHLRHRRGDYTGSPPRPRRGQLTEALGETAVLEYVESAGLMYVLLVAGGRVRMRPLGRTAQFTGPLEHLPFAMRRAAARDPRTAEAAGGCSPASAAGSTSC